MKIAPNNVPLELFGHDTSLVCPINGFWQELKQETQEKPFKNIICPFSSGNCDKIRKAKPNALIGNCSLRHTNLANQEHQDWIVCPKRFEQENIIFKDCFRLLKEKGKNIKYTTEVKLDNAGRIDFALVDYSSEYGLKDFLAIEVQSMGTSNSGSIWDARNDYLNDHLKHSYNYSLNKKDASKKILVQLLHKGEKLSQYGYSQVLVIQDYFLEHLREQYNINGYFHEQNSQDLIHIHSYKLTKINGKYTLKLKEAISTPSVQTLSMCMVSNPSKHTVLANKLESRISERYTKKRLYELL